MTTSGDRMAEMLRRMVARQAQKELHRQEMERSCFFPFSEEAHELVRCRLSSMRSGIDDFAASALANNAEAQQHIAARMKWGMDHLHDARGTWPNDESPSSDDQRRRASQRKQDHRAASTGRSNMGGPGPPGQVELAGPREVTMEEIMASGTVWDDERSRRVAGLKSIQLAVR